MEQRRDWLASQLDLDPAKLVFVDEAGASTSLTRKHGRCRRGRRLRAAVPHGHDKTVTFVAGLRLRGLAAPRVYDRPMNAALFEEWVEIEPSWVGAAAHQASAGPQGFSPGGGGTSRRIRALRNAWSEPRLYCGVAGVAPAGAPPAGAIS